MSALSAKEIEDMRAFAIFRAVTATLVLETISFSHAAEVHKAEAAKGASEAAAKASYETNCGACHQPNGTGMPGVFPPLAGNKRVAAEPARTIDIAINGLSGPIRSEEHTSELQSRPHLVCRLLLEKKKKKNTYV